ncbi:hypothetical protein OIV83_001774 [Microbotryomycetes sp. JL201]|nr:hypothetical protein OIV83_001774 [Microbotryomycetes sp. JL201]
MDSASFGDGPLPSLPSMEGVEQEHQPAASTSALSLGDLPPLPAPGTNDGDAPIALARPRRQRKQRQFLSDEEYDDDNYMQPSRNGHAPKIKLKIGHGGGGGRRSKGQSGNAANQNNANQGTGIGPGGLDMSGVGWDRELDSDADEPLAVEEQFILRVPEHIAPQMRELVEARNVTPDVWFKFKDSRRAVFNFKDQLYGAKLVDLPALIESQKLRGVGGATVKVADISQMLLVEDAVKDEAEVVKDKTFNTEDFIYPHGLTAPLRHVRKRRFRKRHDKKTIELVEAAVEKLLEKDSKATQVELEMLDHDVPSEDEYDATDQPAGEAQAGSGAGPKIRLRQGSMSSVVDGRGQDGDDGGDDGGEGQYDEDEEYEQRSEGGGSGYDSDLADEINKGMAALEQSASDDESGSDGGGGLFGDSGSEDDDEEDQTTDPVAQEQKKRIKLLLEETGDLDRAISAKEAELAKAANPIFKKRFEEMIKKLTNERDLKKAQHSKAVAELEKRQAAVKDAQDQFMAQTTAASNAAAAAGASSTSGGVTATTNSANGSTGMADHPTTGLAGSGSHAAVSNEINAGTLPASDKMDTSRA